MKVAEDRLSLFAEYAIDRARCCLLHGDSPVHLRPQAYQLLSYLAEHPGVLVSKDEIIRQIWQGRAVGDDSLVQCLRDVRHALGVGGMRHIVTVRGRGYIFDPAPLSLQTQPAAAPASAVPASAGFIGSQPALATGSSSPQAPGRSLLTKAAWLVFAGLLAAAGTGYRVFGSRPLPPAEIRDIAVLPFVNETGDSETDYITDGSTESLIDNLAQVANVSVKPRSTVFRFKGLRMTPQAIASDLGVQAVVAARVHRIEDSLVATVALIDGRNGTELWGGHYTYKLYDLQSMQRQAALDIATALKGQGARADIQALRPGYTTDGDAYLLYLRGRYHFFKNTEAEMRAAIGFYQRAADVDSRFALAWWGLAEANRALSIVGQVPSKIAFPAARAAALKALELDSTLAEAHIALGWISFSYDWDWAAAERELQAAIALSPGNTDAHRAYAHMLSNMGRHQEALVEAARARELDPRTVLTGALEGQFLLYAGKLAEAENRLRKTLEIEPRFWVAHLGLGRVFILRGMYPEAIAALRRAGELSNSSTESMTQLGYALAASGDSDGARAIYRELEKRSADTYVPAYSFAMISNGLGNNDAALRWLARSVAEHEVQATFIKVDTRWDRLRPDPRFVAQLQLVHLAQ